MGSKWIVDEMRICRDIKAHLLALLLAKPTLFFSVLPVNCIHNLTYSHLILKSSLEWVLQEFIKRKQGFLLMSAFCQNRSFQLGSLNRPLAWGLSWASASAWLNLNALR